MKAKIYFMVTILTIIVTIASCNEEAIPVQGCTNPTATNYNPDAEEDDGSCTYIPPVDTLCEGNGSSSYLPLALNNSWQYSVSTGGPKTITVVGIATFNSIDYFHLTHTPGTDDYWRVAPNGDVYDYENNTNEERLLVPANPVLNQQWPLFNNVSRKVTLLNDSVFTAGCTWRNCIRIVQMDQNGTVLVVDNYKKGIGLVKREYTANFPFNTSHTLIDITLH